MFPEDVWVSGFSYAVKPDYLTFPIIEQLCKARGEEDFSYSTDGCGWSETSPVSEDGQTKSFTMERSLALPVA